MEGGLKRGGKSETALPVEEVDSDSPAGSAPETGATPGTSFVASFRGRASELLATAMDAVEAAKGRAFAAKAEAGKKVTDTVAFVRGKATQTVEAVHLHVAEVVQAVQDTKAAAFDYATSARSLAASTWSEFRSKGTKAFVLDAASGAKEKAITTTTVVKGAVAERYDAARKTAVERATGAAELAKAKATQVSTVVHDVATDKKFQVSAASAASGAVALGTSGGATGLAAGGVLGAAVGLVPALFTFGLSIPIGAAIGGGAGLVVGTAVGGTVGAVGGGAAGYGAYTKKEDIGKCADYVKSKAAETREMVKDKSNAAFGRAMDAVDSTKAKAYASAEYMAEKASAAKSRLVGRSGTGGTETAD